MPIVNLPANPPQPAPQLRDKVTITDAKYRHNLVDTSCTPLSALITHIEGITWITDYYSQVLGGDEELSPFQIGQSPPYQQYHLIRNYQQKLQGGLSTSVDDETKVVTVTGSSLLYPQIRPNQGDAFLADIGDGNLGQFTVLSAVPKTIFKETTYEISFELSRYATEDIVNTLNQRVVRTSQFVADYLLYGESPIVASDALTANAAMQAAIADLQTQWFSLFYSYEYRTMMVPGQIRSTYDPYVVKMMLDILQSTENNLVPRVRQLNCDGILEANQPSIWDALTKIDNTLFGMAFTEPLIVSSTSFHNFPYFESVRYSGVAEVVVAKVRQSTVDSDYGHMRPLVGRLYTDLLDMQIDLASAIYLNSFNEFHFPTDPILPTTSIYISDEQPLIHPIANHRGYVFSDAFYSNTTATMSKLELLVRQYLRDDGIVNRDVIMALVASTVKWGRLEKYYYYPVLIILLIVSSRRG